MDTGIIAIVPLISETPVNHWKCILVDNTKQDDTCLRCYGIEVTDLKWRVSHVNIHQIFSILNSLQELDGRELLFLSDSCPAKRFLFFRFIITYLNAKIDGNNDFANEVDTEQSFWASPGSYLRKSTLTMLSRNVSGMEIPPNVYKDNTFEDQDVEMSGVSTVNTDHALVSLRFWLEHSNWISSPSCHAKQPFHSCALINHLGFVLQGGDECCVAG